MKMCPHKVTGKVDRAASSREEVLRQPLTMGDLMHVVDNLDVYRSCCDWITNYLAQPHPDLGRAGSVCPFAAPAIMKDTLQMAVVRFTDLRDKKDQVRQAIQHYRKVFLNLRSSDENRALHAILILFPNVSPHDAKDLIDDTKEELKAEFVQEGLMLGEFHPMNQSPGIHNPAFKPLRSSIPMLAIRRMVVTDYVFLDRPEYEPLTRSRYLETYLKVSGIADSSIRRELERTLTTLKADSITS